jgi:hypothetical protein
MISSAGVTLGIGDGILARRPRVQKTARFPANWGVRGRPRDHGFSRHKLPTRTR